jgi:hypothetical protein
MLLAAPSHAISRACGACALLAGNSPGVELSTEEAMLVNQQQVFLPTNNALSDVGHVAHFIDQLGQGIQHLASRVPDLVAFIQRANTYRAVTQKGLVFLSIPRSYYGRLTLEDVSAALDGCEDSAEAVLSAVAADGLVDNAGIVELDLAPGAVAASIRAGAPGLSDGAVSAAAAVVERGRYANLYSLLRDHLSEGQYIEIVRNQILVDIQGGACPVCTCACCVHLRVLLQSRTTYHRPMADFICVRVACVFVCGDDVHHGIIHLHHRTVLQRTACTRSSQHPCSTPRQVKRRRSWSSSSAYARTSVGRMAAPCRLSRAAAASASETSSRSSSRYGLTQNISPPLPSLLGVTFPSSGPLLYRSAPHVHLSCI